MHYFTVSWRVVLCCPQQLQVNGIDVVTKGQKARRAIVYGINGVLQPVQRNCDEVETVFRYVSNLMTLVQLLKICYFPILIDLSLWCKLQKCEIYCPQHFSFCYKLFSILACVSYA